MAPQVTTPAEKRQRATDKSEEKVKEDAERPTEARGSTEEEEAFLKSRKAVERMRRGEDEERERGMPIFTGRVELYPRARGESDENSGSDESKDEKAVQLLPRAYDGNDKDSGSDESSDDSELRREMAAKMGIGLVSMSSEEDP